MIISLSFSVLFFFDGDKVTQDGEIGQLASKFSLVALL